MKEETVMKNRLHKIISLLLAVCMLATAGLAFADGAPVLDGVHDQSVMAGTEFDALAGITATDANPLRRWISKTAKRPPKIRATMNWFIP